MQRLFISAALLLCASASSAQTTINITLPGAQGSCLYTTGPVLSNATPGQLQATATVMPVGTGCGSASGGVSFGPASQLVTTTTMPLTSSASGESAAFTFQPVNATACTGSITAGTGGVAGSTFTTAFCSAGNCSGLQTVSANFPQNTSTTSTAKYNVSVTCTGSGAPATSGPVVVTVNPTGVVTSCPTIASSTPSLATNFTRAGLIDVFDFATGVGLRHNVDSTQFSAIFRSVWPGNFGDNNYSYIPQNTYVSAAFQVPSNYFTASNVPASLVGLYQIQNTAFVAPFSMTISTTCGDFSNPASGGGSTVVSGCYENLGGAGGGALIWRNTGACTLTSGASYFLNIINADISTVTPGGGTAASTADGCAGGKCTDPIYNTGNWSTYVPH